MFTVQQAKELGATKSAMRRWSREGRWYNKCRSLWSLNKNPSFEGWVWGGLLLGGDGAAIGGRAAAHLWGFGPEPDVIDVWSPGWNRPRTGKRWRFRDGARASEGEPVRTTIEQTVLDLCSESARVDDVVGWMTKALSKTKVTSTSLLRHARDSPNQPRRALILEVLAETQEGIESPLERRYLRDVELAHGLPTGVRQLRRKPGRIDVAYVDFRMLVELDGAIHHSGLAAQTDMDRDNENLLAGLLTLRFGWLAVAGDPCKTAWQVAKALQQAGWTGVLSPCAQCIHAPQ